MDKVFFNVLREREPWGAGRYYVEATNDQGERVFVTDPGGKAKVQHDAIREANDRGLVYGVR